MQACSYETVDFETPQSVSNDTIPVKISKYRPGFLLVYPFKDYKDVDVIIGFISLCLAIEVIFLVYWGILLWQAANVGDKSWGRLLFGFALAAVLIGITAGSIHEFRKIWDDEVETRFQLHPDYDAVFAGRDTDKLDAIVDSARLVSLVPTLVVETDDGSEDIFTTEDKNLEQRQLRIEGTLQQREHERKDDDDEPEYYQVFVPTDVDEPASEPSVTAMVSSVIDGAVIVTADDLTRYSMELPDGAKLLYDGETLSVGSPAGSSRAVKRLYAHVVVDRDLYKSDGPNDPTDQMPLGRITVSHNDETHALFSYSTCAATDGADGAAGAAGAEQ